MGGKPELILIVTGSNLYPDRITDAGVWARLALESIAKHDLLPTPENYAVWYEYHSGQNPALVRTIDILESNQRAVDGSLAQDLYEDFFSSAPEEQALQGISDRVQDTLHEVLGTVEAVRADATRFGLSLNDASARFAATMGPLTELLDRLSIDAREMARRAGRFGFKLQRSAETIRDLKQALADVRKEAITDGLTGIANRRCFDARLREAAGEAMNSGEDLAMLLGDIDHFKIVNDTWGHPAGDKILRIVADVIQQSVRGQDIVARYGGEEFAVILPSTSLVSAVAVGNNIRRMLEKAQILQRVAHQPGQPVTMSMGAACYDPGEPLPDWIRRADNALYRAKHNGRNRVEYE